MSALFYSKPLGSRPVTVLFGTGVYYDDGEPSPVVYPFKPAEAQGGKGGTFFEMITRPQQSTAGAAVTFSSTWTEFNRAWFDRAAFYLQIQAVNQNATHDYSVIIEDSLSGNTVVSYTVPANTTPEQALPLLAFTPPAGILNLRMILPATEFNDDVQVYSIGPYIRQLEGFTKTSFLYPILRAGAINRGDLVSGDSRFVFSPACTGFLEESNSGLFKKVSGAWGATIATWTWGTVAGNTFGGYCEFVLHNQTSGNNLAVVNNHATGTPTLVNTDFADGLAEWTAGDEFVMYSQACATFVANNSVLLRSYIRVNVENFTKGLAFFPVVTSGRLLIGPGDYNIIASVYFEVTGEETGAGTQNVEAQSATSPLSSSGVTTEAQINPAGAAKTRYTQAFTTPVSSKYWAQGFDGGSGGLGIQMAYVVLVLQA